MVRAHTKVSIIMKTIGCYYEDNRLQEEWPFRYSVSNNVLTIPEEYEYHGTFRIEQLTGTQLVLFEEIDDNGHKAATTYTFRKI